jgi:hypothetical protein
MSDAPETEDHVLVCARCGASVYKEHLDHKLAGFHAGELLCVHCMREHNEATQRSRSAPGQSGAWRAGDTGSSVAFGDKLELADEAPASAGGTTAGSMTGSMAAPPAEETPFARPLARSGVGASRCRTFHSKLSDEAVRHLDQQINEWLEQNPDIEIKFSTSTVGVWSGKHAEPNLIVTVFY